MPLFYQQNINENTRLAVWEIAEPESFFLSAVPLQRSITHPHKRLQHLAGRYLLPFLFADFPYEEIEIADTCKPFLPYEQYHFSISHCGNYAAAIVSSAERVGIDVELITPRVEKIKHKFLHTDELAFIHSFEADRQIPLLTLLWSAKEAMFKWWGRGDVDFSEAMQTKPFDMQQEGLIHGSFQKGDAKTALLLHYQLRETLSLVWLHSEGS
ncbi:MAG: hypothetical protein NVSMB63_07260 [Sediminibacterium sp.]